MLQLLQSLECGCSILHPSNIPLLSVFLFFFCTLSVHPSFIVKYRSITATRPFFPFWVYAYFMSNETRGVHFLLGTCDALHIPLCIVGQTADLLTPHGFQFALVPSYPENNDNCLPSDF